MFGALQLMAYQFEGTPPSQVPSVSRLGQVQRHMSRPEAINVFPTYSMCSRDLWYISV